MGITLFIVGNTLEEALAGQPFDDFDMADEYRRDNGYKNIYQKNVEISAEGWSDATGGGGF